MATILIYDADYCRYPSVIPNLECAKYAAYQKKKRNIVTLHNEFEPERYTHTFFRKEYDDGIYDNKILHPSVEYGGRAFSEVYKPLDKEIELIEPDFSIYEKYKHLYGTSKHKQEQLSTILHGTNIRLSIDNQTLIRFPFGRLQPRHPSVIFHDYDITKIDGAFDLINEIAHSRPSGLSYRIGNKYPINVYNFKELQKWLTLPPMGQCFYLQYNGVFTDEEIIELIKNPTMGFRQLVYNITYEFQTDQEFAEKALADFYKQALYLRSKQQKILLNIDTSFFKTRELLNLMKLIICFYGKTQLTYIRPERQTLFGYCAWKRRAYLEVLPWVHFVVTQQEMREGFQYARVHNYEAFKMFYTVPNVIESGGKLINEWERNSLNN